MKLIMDRCEFKPDRIRLENTNVCFAKCNFCPHNRMKRPLGRMTMDLFKYLVKQIADWKVNELVVQGFGEPLVDPNFFERVTYAKSLGINKIQTNVNSEYIKKHLVKDLLNCGLDELFISCNDKGEDNVRYLLKQQKSEYPKIYLSFIDGVTKPYKKLKGQAGVSISFPHNWGGAVNLPKTYTPHRDPCRLLWVTMYVTWEGIVHLCCMDYDARVRVADAKVKPLKQIWYEDNSFYRDLHRDGKWDEIEVCRGCVYNHHNKSPWWV
jgi:MoaA/NifB/PqqE/SkfB family radical SAM enzyme